MPKVETASKFDWQLFRARTEANLAQALLAQRGKANPPTCGHRWFARMPTDVLIEYGRGVIITKLGALVDGMPFMRVIMSAHTSVNLHRYPFTVDIRVDMGEVDIRHGVDEVEAVTPNSGGYRQVAGRPHSIHTEGGAEFEVIYNQ